MKVARLFEEHRKFQAQGLTENLGDGYLMAHNGVFKRVRQKASAYGYRFSSNRDEAYETFPLVRLESVIEKKIFPYSNNVVALESLTPAALDVLTWEDIDGNLKKNFVFHEACHGVVRAFAKESFEPLGKPRDLDSSRAFALRMLLEESCANACELFGVTEANDQLHRIFYEMNSYVCEFESRTNLKNAMASIGPSLVVKFMVLSYMQANFLRDGISDSQFKDMITFVTSERLDPAKLKTLRAISKIAFNLSERFRLQTTSFHLRINGIMTPSEDLFDYDFLRELRRLNGVEKFLNQFAGLVHG